MMVGMSFAMEGLEFDTTSTQNVLMIGLGGGVINNFLSTLGPEMMINLTTVELDSDMLSAAIDWFQFNETHNNRVVIDDGIIFIRDASERGDKYKAILIDACYSELRPLCCPVEGFYNPDTIADISNILEENGIVSVNVVTTSEKNTSKKEQIMAAYKKHFTSCSYTIISPQQQVLFCTHRKKWSYHEQESRFQRNLQRVDQTFDFQLKNSYTTH
ncbi:hypothetical protein NECAME_03678 [Necator americanus]|uniref:PABS domain-containing protein n=1 Tax=Necator americanus TaxID=51031 RepID=W2T396_NECAM|nr:hypothetical protein NECAME_03678 [Necator americanus]ETN75706.1 hypothetical protein NECAME_03678 [Necator americanus]